MTKKQFDELVRRRIASEEMHMSRESEARIARKMNEETDRTPVRTVRIRPLVAVIVALMLLCGVAIAAVTWNSRAYLTYPDEKGGEAVNEELLSYVQPVGRSFEGDTLKMDVIDAIFDGTALVMTWTMENKSDSQVYLLCDMLVNGDFSGQGGRMQVDEIFIEPGETIESGLTTRVDGDGEAIADAGQCAISLAFTALRPKGEIVKLAPLDGNSDTPEEDFAAHIRWIDEQVEMGNIVLAGDGVIELGSHTPPYREGMTRAEMYGESGLLEPVGALDVALEIPRNAEVKSALPDGKPIEKDNGAYILRVTRADLTPNAATIHLERVFKTQADAEAFSGYYTQKAGPYWGFNMVDETGDIWWSHNSGGGSTTDGPVEQADGAWVWDYHFSAVDIVRPPKTLTVVPCRDDSGTGEHNVAFPDEGLVLEF